MEKWKDKYSKMLTFGGFELRLYRFPFYYSCNFSVNLKGERKEGRNLWNEDNIYLVDLSNMCKVLCVVTRI